ncbi:Tex family protein [Pirellulaceae bacterium SH467]|jgi:uncharacterized protein
MSSQNLVEVLFDLKAICAEIAKAIEVQSTQVIAAVELLDAGNTIPFIARYRKEATRGLDEVALRFIQDSLEKARELHARKGTVLKTICELGALTPELQKQILECQDLSTLEAIYAPYKPKRRTRATLAKERGLEPLAELLLRQTNLGKPRLEVLKPYVRVELGVPDEEAALAGALDIVAEQWSEDAETRIWITDLAMRHGRIVSKVKRGKKEAAEKFEQYLDYSELVSKIPSHRFLAIQRGEAEGILNASLDVDRDEIVAQMRSYFLSNPRFEFHRELIATVEDCLDRLLLPVTESTVMQKLKERSDDEAIQVFAKNLRELLLAPPAGPRVTLGVDPGFRTGCKLAVVDGTGKYMAHATIYPTPPTSDTAGAEKTVLGLIQRYNIELIAIGNGTASRETDSFFANLIRSHQLSITKAMVSESGASIYSASELAGREYPDLDVTVRGAISIAHRLQDPLAELVKTDPKSIGVGQYQHDVNQSLLKKSLEREVESCVNRVGVDLNMASVSLLSFVSGIGPKLAENIVRFRDEKGRFADRNQLLKVPKLGPKAFEQSAGFLRIREGSQPLDNSAVHPECYPLVERIAMHLRVPIVQMVGMQGLEQKVRASDLADSQFGAMTITDVIQELSKPGRDPRREFKAVHFSDEVQSMDDLKEGMVLEGLITNVTHFGAFVDIGVHQDGLIHISQLSNTFVKDPNEIVSVGDSVKVKVLEVDIPRKRISLTRKFQE